MIVNNDYCQFLKCSEIQRALTTIKLGRYYRVFALISPCVVVHHFIAHIYGR